jgi:hypothetical protein
MSIDTEVLIETYTILKEYIPPKERQAASDNLMSLLADSLSEKELKDFGSTDGYTKRSLEEYVNDEDEDEETDYEN